MQTTTLSREQLIRRKLDLLLRTGQLLVESAADTNRIIRNMKRTAAFLGLPEDNLHINVQYNMLMVNLSDDEHSFSKFQRCENHQVNMTTLSLISKLSWRAIREDYSIERYAEELERIARRPRNYRPWLVALGTGFAAGGFALQFGCDWVAFLYAMVSAIVGIRVRVALEKKGINPFMAISTAVFVSSMIAWSTTLLPAWTSTPLQPLLACVLFPMPGVPLINFVDDMLDNYIQVGITRAINSFLIITSLSFGIALFLKLVDFDLTRFYAISTVSHHSFWVLAASAVISAIGFSMIFNVPQRVLGVVALCSVVAVCARNYVGLGPATGNIGLDLGLIFGSLVGSTLVSLMAVKLVHRVHVPNHVISIPSVIPLIPGVFLYRALVGVVEMNGAGGYTAEAFHFGLTAVLIVMSISIGVAIPNVFARRWVAKSRRVLLRKLVKERKERGHFVDLSEL